MYNTVTRIISRHHWFVIMSTYEDLDPLDMNDGCPNSTFTFLRIPIRI